jgi:spore coat protein U-like protein
MSICSVYTNPISFSGYPGDGNLAGNGDVQVNCASGTTYHVSLNAGQNYDGTSRRVAGAYPYPTTNYLNYKIYKDGGYSQEWGDSDYANTYSAGSSISDVGTGLAQSHTAYGLLANSLLAPTTSYYDTVTVNVDF